MSSETRKPGYHIAWKTVTYRSVALLILAKRDGRPTLPVMAIFGGTTEIQKEIIGRGLGL